MAKLLQLRFLDTSDSAKPTFVTLFADGQYAGYFKRESKEAVDKSAEGTSCKIQRGLLTEVRGLGYPWKQVNTERFKKLLQGINAKRIKSGWEPVELPE